MDNRQKITEILNEAISDIFMQDKEYIASHHDLNFRKDLNASSIQYYPLITDLEELLDIDIDAHDFQYKSFTIGDAVEFLTELYTTQKGS